MSAFAPSPSYRTMDVNEFIVSALDQPMSLGSTLWDQATGGVLDSFGLGTGVREAMTPNALAVPPEGTTTQEQFEQAARRTGRPVGAAIGEMFALQENEAKALSEDEWKASENYRDAIPYDRGMTTERAAALAEMHDIKRVREFYAAKRPITAFVGNFAGQALDPINYLPVFGPAARAAAVAKAGRIGGTALTASAEAAISTAVAGVATAPMREKFGDDVSYEAMVNEVAMAALIGGAFGTVAGALGRRADARDARLRLEAQAKLETLKRVQEARATLNDAVQSLAIDGEVRVSPATQGAVSRVAEETRRISEAWDQVRADPNGPVRDPVVAIEPDDIERTLLVRGQFKGINGEAEVQSRAGFGLVKLIWGHGPESAKEAPEFQIRKEDITDLPNIVRRYEPTITADGMGREWRVERDGRTVVYSDRAFDGGDRHVVTAYVQQPNRAGAELPLSTERPAATRSSSEVSSPLGDTTQSLTPRTSEGQLQPASQTIAEPAPFGNEGANEAAAVAPRVGKPEDMKALAAQYGVNPETGEFDELADVARLEAEGRLTEAEIAEIREADAVLTRGTSYGEALKAAVSCLL